MADGFRTGLLRETEFPCKGGFSNTPDGTLNHQYDANGYCIYCGAPHIAYTVTIPATLDGTTHVTAPYTIQNTVLR